MDPKGAKTLRTEQRASLLVTSASLLVTGATLVITSALLVVTMFAIRNKCHATSNKKLLGAKGIARNGARMLLVASCA